MPVLQSAMITMYGQRRFRRKPTNLGFWEAKAILAGDALLNTACEILLDAVLADDRAPSSAAAA